MRPRKYYQYIEKDGHVVSQKWRVLHIIFFFGICSSSLVGAWTFCDIFDIFNYRCILFAKASTKFLNIVYKNKTEAHNETDVDYFRLNLGIDEQDYEMEMYSGGKRFNINNAVKVPGAKDIYMINEELWIDNETLTGRAHVGMTTTIFSSVLLCDFVVFVPFLSVVTSVFFTILVILFSRTGRGSLESIPPAFLYVYPLIIAASAMSVMSIIAFDVLHNGLNVFCKYFVHLTGQTECTPLMDYFTKEQRRGHRHFFGHLYLGKRAYLTAAFFWIGQLVVGVLRLLTAADFTLTSVLIKSKSKWDDEDAEDIFLMRWDTKPAPQLAIVVEGLKNV